MSDPVKVFIAEHCEPCKEIKELLTEGKFSINGEEGKVDLIDIETEEGFPHVAELGLSSVPVAYYHGKKCELKIDDENKILLIECKEVI